MLPSESLAERDCERGKEDTYLSYSLPASFAVILALRDDS